MNNLTHTHKHVHKPRQLSSSCCLRSEFIENFPLFVHFSNAICSLPQSRESASDMHFLWRGIPVCINSPSTLLVVASMLNVDTHLTCNKRRKGSENPLLSGAIHKDESKHQQVGTNFLHLKLLVALLAQSEIADKGLEMREVSRGMKGSSKVMKRVSERVT